MAMKSPYRIQVVVQLLALLAIALAILATVCDARRNAPLAGIFGINGDRGKKNGQQNANRQQQQQQQQRPPPPPKKTGRAFGLPGSTPPPPPKKQQDRQSSQQSSPPPPPPRSKSLQTAKESTNKLSLSKDEVKAEVVESSKASVENSTITDGGKTPLVATKEYRGDGLVQPASLETPLQPPRYSGQSAVWHGQEGVPQQQYDYDYGYDPNHLYYLQEELNDSLAREHSLVAQIHNLTDVTLALEQREFLHKQQLDVLTEKVVDVENRAAADRNLVIEYEANCTALGTTIEALRDDVEEWRSRCDEWSKKHQEDEETLSELRQAIKEKKSEAEDLAIAMEDLRMIEERRREQAIHPKSSSKSGGLLSWVFSLLIGKKSSKRYENDDEIRADAFEMAKSTLLRALQSERMNVHELESAVVSLQQNNSAISGMVESRDNIIDELNNRIAVFEEDKVTLKAALRELQREMKEEEPKAQKLIANLADAEHEIERLKEDYHSIVETHQDELSKLRNAMSRKQSTITEAESNLTAIGTYVDKLEDRLTSFAMTRRDMETREKKCKEIETKSQETELQRAAIAKEVEELKQREDEVKTVMVELAENRTKLLQENRRLYTEQEFRIGEIEKLTSRIDALETESASMREEVGEWKSKCENLGFDLEGSQTNTFNLKQQVEELSGAQKQLDTLKLEKRAVTEINEKLREEIADAKKEKEGMKAKLLELSNEIKRRETAEKAAPPSPKSNDVPLRSVRKAFSKATGLHGVLTPSSSKGGEK